MWYEPAASDVADRRSPVWGGATLGLLVGLVVGFFRESYWLTVLISVSAGVLLGFVADFIAATAKKFTT